MAVLGARISNRWAGNLTGQSYDDMLPAADEVNAHTVVISAPTPAASAPAAAPTPSVVIT